MSWKDVLKLDVEEEFEPTEDPDAFRVDPRVEAHREGKLTDGRRYQRRAEKIDPSLREPYSSYPGTPRAYGRLNSVESKKLRRKMRQKEPVYIDTDEPTEKYPADYTRQRVRD